MSGGSSANNSWTILTSEGTAAETLRPLAGGTEHHEESPTSAEGCGENNQPANGAESAEGLPVEDYPVSEEKIAVLNGDSSTDQHTAVPATVTDSPVPPSLEVPDSLVHGSDEASQAEDLPEDPAQFSPDPDSSSDSYTRITPSPDEPPLSPLSTETLGGAEFAQEEEKLAPEETPHPLNGEEPPQEGEESDQYQRTADLGKQAAPDFPVDSEVGDQSAEKTGEEGEPEVRRRRSLLAALEQIGRREEEEEEEEFQLPQREEDSGFSVNKCILGAVILLGLGTIFFSGVFMDLDEESDYGTRELKDTEVPGKQDWLNPDVPPPSVDADNSELLNKLAEGSQHIAVLQAQLQAQNEELKVAKGQAAEGAKERLLWEEVEKENSRLKTEMASLPVLLKENERMKKELESVPALQKELETLRSTVTELKLSSAASQTAQAPVKPSASPSATPSTGQPADSSHGTAESTRYDQKGKKKDLKKDKYDTGEKKEWKEGEKSVWKEGEKRERKDGGKKEFKKGKHEQGMYEKEKDKEGKHKRHSDETKQWKEKDGRKEKVSRGDEGKPWKDREGKKEWIEKSEKKERKEEKPWKKAKHEKANEGKQWRGKEEKKGGKDHGERHKGKEEWKGEKEWKKVKNGFKESGKEKWETKDRKEKGEKKEWKKDTEWKDRNGKEGKAKGERKQWEDGKNHGKERTRKDERKQWHEDEGKSKNGKHEKEWKRKDETWKRKEEEWKRGGQKEKKHNGDGKKDRSNSKKNKDAHGFTGNHGRKEEHLYGDQSPPHTHHGPSLEQPEYWAQQKDRLQHNPKPPQQCHSLETCAQAERLLPVPLAEFEAILQTYLAKAEEAGVEESKREELKKLAADFFKDGVFVHDQMSFQDFVEDVGDILEDMVEGDENEEEEDSAIEEEMEGFEREVMKKFSMPGAGEREERIKGEWRKESGQGRG